MNQTWCEEGDDYKLYNPNNKIVNNQDKIFDEEENELYYQNKFKIWKKTSREVQQKLSSTSDNDYDTRV